MPDPNNSETDLKPRTPHPLYKHGTGSMAKERLKKHGNPGKVSLTNLCPRGSEALEQIG